MKANTLSLKTNRFFDDGAYIGSKSMQDIVKDNILSDYNTGVKNGSITTIPSNIYANDTSTPVVSWENGQIIPLGSVVRICNSAGESTVHSKKGTEVLFRVYSKEVAYDGEPLIKLGLMQVK